MTEQRSYRVKVLGLPGPQGSKRHVGGGRMVESSAKVAPWRDAVSHAAATMIGDAPPLDGPLKVMLHFRLSMPQSRPAAVRRAGGGWSNKKPDLDKLVRSTLDALTTSGMIADDARVALLHASKLEMTQGGTGCLIVASMLEPLDGVPEWCAW